ncbi:MAG: hypothetical protein ACYC92_15305, partial [Candidatus Acidiferrales bacterium]
PPGGRRYEMRLHAKVRRSSRHGRGEPRPYESKSTGKMRTTDERKEHGITKERSSGRRKAERTEQEQRR